MDSQARKFQKKNFFNLPIFRANHNKMTMENTRIVKMQTTIGLNCDVEAEDYPQHIFTLKQWD